MRTLPNLSVSQPHGDPLPWPGAAAGDQVLGRMGAARKGVLGNRQVTKKARKETVPAAGLYSAMSQAAQAKHEVVRSREYKDAGNPDLEVPLEERAKSYKARTPPPAAALRCQQACFGASNQPRGRPGCWGACTGTALCNDAPLALPPR